MIMRSIRKKLKTHLCLCGLLMASLTFAPVAISATPSTLSVAPSTLSTSNSSQLSHAAFSGFADAVHHYRNKFGSDYNTYPLTDVKHIADNVLLYQRHNGGWIENQDPARILSPAEINEFMAKKADDFASFDNRNIFSQIEYLYAVYQELREVKYRDAALKGLDYLLSQQIESCGGWPHSVPSRQSYHRYITFADDVTVGALQLLRKVAMATAPFTDVRQEVRDRAVLAKRRGDACVLALQIKQGDALTAWAGQYEPNTLTPMTGRSFELASIVAWESVGVVRYLMEEAEPSPQMITAIESAIAWFKKSQLHGVALIDVPLEHPQKFEFHTATVDRQLVARANAPALWARFYDLTTNAVVLANRSGERVANLADIHLERRSGYAWYGDWPAELVTQEYPRWQAARK